jgi:hypothetical protein
VRRGFWWGDLRGKRPFGTPRHNWEDDIKMDLQEGGWGMDMIDLAQIRNRWRALVSKGKKILVP